MRRNVIMCIGDRAGERDYDKFIQLSVIHISSMLMCQFYGVQTFASCSDGVVSLQFRLNVT